MDISSPEGFSVNDGIPEALCSFLYVTIVTMTVHVQDRIPPTLLKLLVAQQPDWTSQNWKANIFIKVSTIYRRSYQFGSNQYLKFCNIVRLSS